MQDNVFSVLAVLLVFSTSFNLARCSASQDFESTRGAQKIKASDRRSVGLVPYPRIGRNSEMASFPRSDRTLGMLQYPRVGRSDVSSYGNPNRLHDASTDAEFEFYAAHDVDSDAPLDPDYEDRANGPMAFRHGDGAPRDGFWLMADRARGYKDPRIVQKVDVPRLYLSILRDPRNTQGQGGYTPRLGRENEHDAAGLP